MQITSKFGESLSYFDNATAIDPEYKDAISRKGISLMALGNLSAQTSSLTRLSP
jgi:hypothetical protein